MDAARTNLDRNKIALQAYIDRYRQVFRVRLVTIAGLSLAVAFSYSPVTAIGYFGDPADLPEHLHKMEVSPRQRKPLEEFVFSAWEQPAQL